MKLAAVFLLAVITLFSLAACSSPEPQIIEVEKEVIREVEVVKEVIVVVTATPAPTQVPTSAPIPSPTPARVAERPTPPPTATRAPRPTPTPEANDHFVVLSTGNKPDDGSGRIEFFIIKKQGVLVGGLTEGFYHEKFFINYLVKEGVITSAQRNAYFRDDPVQKVHLISLGTALYKLYQDDPHNASRLRIRCEVCLLKYADKSAVDANRDAPGSANDRSSSEGGGYVVIRDGSISVSGTNEDGITTSVSIDTLDTGELLDYLLSENKITVAQRDEYGRTGELELSLADMPDFFDWAISEDEGLYVGVDEEGVDYIRHNLLPLFGWD